MMAQAENQITVKPGQTIIKIMRKAYPDQRSRWPALMRQVVSLNPQAFDNDDPRTLKVGVVLNLPEKSSAKSKKIKRARAATVKTLSGSVTLFDNNKNPQTLVEGKIIYVGDQLLTTDSGSATLSFIDGASLKLRCNSLFSIEQYKMRSRGSESQLSLIKGSLSTKTGRIGKRSKDKYNLKTPVGNVTGTQAEYGVRVHQSQACGKQAPVSSDGLYVAVLNGKVTVSNKAGKQKVSSGDAVLATKKNALPTEIAAFSGMVFGEKSAAKSVAKSKPVYKAVEDEPEEAVVEDNGIPVWWMIASMAILGITF